MANENKQKKKLEKDSLFSSLSEEDAKFVRELLRKQRSDRRKHLRLKREKAKSKRVKKRLRYFFRKYKINL